ncbi:MAG: hypothetical protein IPK75_01430 [Acidobacteria bacterium]|nr:hypothetical protein [Acidobacteriota bacterium]
MATPKQITGANLVMRAPPGDEDRVGDLHVYRNRGGLVSAWQLSDEEVAEIVRTRTVYLSIMGGGMPPVYLGAESDMRAFTLDYGGVLPPQEG